MRIEFADRGHGLIETTVCILEFAFGAKVMNRELLPTFSDHHAAPYQYS
jgi:hypothetical protein